MKTTNVRAIKEAINLQAMRGTRRVSLDKGDRVIGAKKAHGQLKVRLLGSSDTWQDVTHVNID